MLRMTMRAMFVLTIIASVSGVVARIAVAQATQTPQTVQTPSAPQTPAAPATAPPSVLPAQQDPDRKVAMALLERLEALVDDALSDKPKENRAVGTAGKREGDAGIVKMDRATLSEIRSLATQVETTLSRTACQ